MEEIRIEYVSIDDIFPYENNPRDNEAAIEPVANSIREFGFRVPIVVDDSMTIVAGHTRYKAAESLGLTEVPIVRASGLSSEQIQAYRIIDNKTQELSKWDFEKLDRELDNIMDIDMTQFGFGAEEEEGVIREQDIDNGTEISLDDFEDENFDTECPMCGFRFSEGGDLDE